MALRTSLVISGDSSGAVDALETADRAMEGAKDEAAELAAAYQRADASIGELARAQSQATAEIAEAKAMYNAGEISLEAYNQALLVSKTELSLVQAEQRAATAAVRQSSAAYEEAVKRGLTPANDNIAKVGKTSQLAGHHVQNLAFQFQDVTMGLLSGQPPMMVFLQQGGQIAGIMGQAGLGVGGLVKQVGGMVVGFLAANPLILAAAAAAGVLGVGVGLVTSEINKNSEVTVTWQDVLLGAYDVVSAALEEQVAAGFEAMGTTAGEVWDWVVAATKRAIDIIIGIVVVVPRTVAATYDKIGPAIGDAFWSGVNLAIDALNTLLGAAEAPLNGMVDAFNTAFGTDIPNVVLGGIARVINPYEGAMEALGSAGANAITSSFAPGYVDGVVGALSGASQKRALERAAKEAGEEAGASAGRAAGKAAGEEYPQAFLEAVNDNMDAVNASVAQSIAVWGRRNQANNEAADAVAALNAEHEQLIDTLAREFNMIGASERERAEFTLSQEKQAFLARNIALGLEEATRRWNEYHDAMMRNFDANAALEQQNAEIDRLAGNLSRLGGLFGQNTGGLITSILDFEVEFRDGEARSLAQELAKTFPEMSDTIANAVQGAVIGGLASQAVLGSSGSGTGAALGGALGGAAATQFLGKALGSFAGPLGSIAGGLIGGLVGGLFKGKERASATVSGIAGQAMQSAISGDNAELRGVADSLASGLIGGLGSIAEALGGEIGSFAAISVGTRKGTFRVDTSGQGRTANMPSFATEAEALAFALQTAIQRGGITGLRPGTQNLLTGPGDLSANLARAQAFEGVFASLERELDPLAFALKQFEREFDDLRTLFDQAGASAAEYAQLEQLYQIEREKVLEEFGESQAANNELLRERMTIEAQILELQGDSVGALAIVRQLEIDAADESLRALIANRHALEDQALAAQEAARAAQDAARAADFTRSLQIRLLEAEGNALAALAMRREDELRGLSATDAAIVRSIHAAQDLATATEEAARANEEAARAAEAAAAAAERQRAATRALTIRALEAMGNAEAALAMQREDQLVGLTAQQQAIQRLIWQTEDATAAQRQYDEALAANIQSLDARRQAIQSELDPLRSELARLVAAITPEEQDLVAAIQVRDVSSQALAFAERIAQASRGILADNREIASMQAAAARRELFRIAETGRIGNADIDQLISSASNFGTGFSSAVDLRREQALTANALATIAEQEEALANAAQAAEEARAARARERLEEQIEILEFQIVQGDAELRALDNLQDEAVRQREEQIEQHKQTIASLQRQLNEAMRQNSYLEQIVVQTTKSTSELKRLNLGQSA